eukprot:7940094-Pyramimonas_sp.AAC.1
MRLLLGDWNATVGTRSTGDDERIVGEYGVGCRNDRGHWLAGWATTHQLTITNTMVNKSYEDQWTYQNDGIKRQVDYCLVDARRTHLIKDAAASDDVILGQDHRALK